MPSERHEPVMGGRGRRSGRNRVISRGAQVYIRWSLQASGRCEQHGARTVTLGTCEQGGPHPPFQRIEGAHPVGDSPVSTSFVVLEAGFQFVVQAVLELAV